MKYDLDGERGRPWRSSRCTSPGSRATWRLIGTSPASTTWPLSKTPRTPSPPARDGVITGQMPDDVRGAVCFSFYATKTITTGEGGMVVTPHEELADRMRTMSLHGLSQQAWNRYSAGGTGATTSWLPATSTTSPTWPQPWDWCSCDRAEGMRRNREAIAGTYADRSAPLPLELPSVPEGVDSAWHLFRGPDRR